MASILFNLTAYRYQSVLDVLQRTYITANQALLKQRMSCFAQLKGIRRGEIEDIFESVDDVSRIDILRFEIENTFIGMQFLRQSTVVMMYHHWEKSVQEWAGGVVKKGSEKSHHDAYVRFCIDQGLKIDCCALNSVQIVVNFIKHNQGSGRWSEKLRDIQLNLVCVNEKSKDMPVKLNLTDKSTYSFFEVMRESGPAIRSDFNPNSAAA